VDVSVTLKFDVLDFVVWEVMTIACRNCCRDRSHKSLALISNHHSFMEEVKEENG
jgi:hypothetical protein